MSTSGQCDRRAEATRSLGRRCGAVNNKNVDLVYIDPPFFTGDDFSFSIAVDGEDFTREPNLIEQKAYRDTWGSGIDGYLAWFHSALSYLHDLLSETGSLRSSRLARRALCEARVG